MARKPHHWHAHPGVRSDPAQLTAGERAADRMRNGMGSWTFMAVASLVLIAWMATGGFGTDPSPYFRLNLALSCFAALQGAILLIAAKRADQVAAEVAMHTLTNTTALMDVNQRQLEILTELQQLRALLGNPDTTGEPS